METKGASVVITHHIKDGKQKEYENWLNKIGAVSKSFDGNIDWQIIRPIPDLTFNYTVIIRFDTIENLKIWMESKERKQLIEEITPIFTKDDNYRIKTGLDFLFESEDEKTQTTCSLETIFGNVVSNFPFVSIRSIDRIANF